MGTARAGCGCTWTTYGGRRCLEHRWAWIEANGPVPPGFVVRHSGELCRVGAQGDRRGTTHSTAVRARIAAAKRGRRRAPMAPEQRALIAAALRGRALSATHRAALSASARQRYQQDSEREKLAAAHRGKPHSPERRAAISAGVRRAKVRRGWTRKKGTA